ncbi:MAG: hypothetical protein GC178_03460 [Flavobacteriales bacterium]|nr:hypothetical protein [Flavobacteriales bacterium]
MKTPITSCLILAVIFSSCNEHSMNNGSDQSAANVDSTLKDSLLDFEFSAAPDLVDERDGRTYKTVKIGNQVWMAENLRYNVGEGSYCYDDKEENCEEYGRLYTWATAMGGNAKEGSQGVCPHGWHIPSNQDWDILIATVGGETAGNLFKTGGKLGFNGDLTGGRMALPDGDHKYIKEGTDVCFWSSESDSSGAFDRNLSNRDDIISKRHYPKNYGFCVRCIQDKEL